MREQRYNTADTEAEQACIGFQLATRTYAEGGFTAAELQIDLDDVATSAELSDHRELADRVAGLLGTVDAPNWATRVATPEFADPARSVQDKCEELFG
ncbi:MAG: hypothetical protein GY926_04740 [bacterium]|nr:hypothetical protein [bacterium]